VLFGGGDVDRFGAEHRWNQQRLGGHLLLVERPLELLVEDAFVRGMHVHDDQALAVLRQDIDAVQLREGVAEWRSAAPAQSSVGERSGGRHPAAAPPADEAR
jgi:hypothetical protein